MKITAGMGSIDEYLPYAAAGVDEVFCGYVPEEWALCYGLQLPANRRETRHVNAQLGSMSELQILSDLRERVGVPVTLAFNALYYMPEQYELLGEIMERCAGEGFTSFIVADTALLLYIRAHGLRYNIHISGELGEINRGVIALCRTLGAKRMIFHRKVTLSDMAACIARTDDPAMEYEAFALNEMCPFHGGFCHSLHCDELDHTCRLPCMLGPVSGTGERRPIRQEAATDALGSGGCGLCALWEMQKIGVTHVKLVGRGNYPENMVRDIRCMKQAIALIAEAQSQGEYARRVKDALFDSECSGMCYYKI